MSPIVQGDRSRARPAGRPLVFDNGRIFRFAQKSDVSYGEAVRAFEVDLLTRTDYVEHEIPQSPILQASGEGWNADGMHQVDLWWAGDRWLASVDGFGEELSWSIGIYQTDPPAGIPDTDAAGQNPQIVLGTPLPNPFRHQVEIPFRIEGSRDPVGVRLGVYDLGGRQVRMLVDEARSPGVHSILWDGRNSKGLSVRPGTYYCRIRCDEAVGNRKLIFLP